MMTRQIHVYIYSHQKTNKSVPLVCGLYSQKHNTIRGRGRGGLSSQFDDVIIYYESSELMGSASSMLTQYDIEEVQEHCNHLFSQQEIVCLYQRFCQLDRNAKGFISSDEFLSIPEFVMNPLSQRLLKMVDGLNFKDFVAFLSAFSTKASAHQKIELIFKVYDSDRNGKVSFKDILEVLKDLSGSYMSDEQREEVLGQVLKEAGYSKDCYLTLDDFTKVLGHSGVKMDVEVPVD
ncbi:unnamed protein product [Trifolium pratense]|uniref:Uncharacterized protein n=1 Tax=Trifolium pratense TaxID=57577 RepID=A0ACB0KXH7_TRIPR|nr:unnamed protein product [Trifolium pratense]